MLIAHSWKNQVETLSFGSTEYQSKSIYENLVDKSVITIYIIGVWEFNEDETKLFFKERIETSDKFKAPVTYTIIELTDEKLILEKDGEEEKIYTAI